MKFKIKNSKLKIVPKAFGAGFTLIELLVVIGIIVLLAGIVMPNFMKQIDKAKKTRARADIHSLENALAMYQTDYGIYPGQSGEDLHGSINVNGNIPELERMLQAVGTNGRGPYLSKDIPNDPYGTKYQYRAPGDTSATYHNPLNNRSYDLWSYGKDKTNDSGGDDDITCWDTGTD
ncbi:type II secretion system major pseudopilin GspG [bacterium]|nr:type II secretion system major pseudopilin GspG [bacterium]